MTVQRFNVVKTLIDVKLGLPPNADGLHRAFNVLLCQVPAEFCLDFAERLLAAASEADKPKVEAALENCTYECAYHTTQGIITSDLYKTHVEPMVTEGEKDLMRGAFAVFTALGWAKSGIVQIKDKERMVARAMDYCEADGHPGHKRAYMLRGISRAVMDIAYGAPYPDGMGTYVCEQTMGMECGDPYGEFVVTKK